jgi:hypothetical protein
MEQVLDVYHRARDPDSPLVCLDEVCKQLLREKQSPLRPRPGIAGREDYEYIRDGVASLFMVYAPLEGIRHTYVSPDGRRTARDYAECLRLIAEEWFPDAPRITLVQDNLNTHKMGSLYERYPAARARGLAARFELVYTPKHGSWLNMAECEISVLARQCLKGRIPDLESLRSETAAWESRRNQAGATTSWRFDSDTARIKLHSLYPSIEV